MYHASPHLTYLLQTDLLKPDVSKLNYPLYPPWDWAEKSEGFFSPNLRCITSGVVDGGSGRQICKSEVLMGYLRSMNFHLSSGGMIADNHFK